MSAVEIILQPEILRENLHAFWRESLEIAATPTGFEFAVPQTYPDGWQIALRLDPVTPTTVRLSDGGKTLWQLAQTGQNIDAEVTALRLRELIDAFKLQRDGWDLFRFIPWPAGGAEIHLFAEALVSIAHLAYLHDPAPKSPNVARQMVEKILRERAIPAQTNHRLEGRVEKRIVVDYFASPHRSVAVQVLARRGAVTSYMEQWGFRWRDLHDAHPRLLRVMLYDPAVQDVDTTSAAIGEAVCDFFGPYHDTARLNEILDVAGRS